MKTYEWPVCATLAAGVGAFLMAGTPAQADTCSILNFTTSTACISPVGGGPGGNVTAATMNSFDGGNRAFGATTDWVLLAELERVGKPDEGSTAFSDGDPYVFSVTYEAPLYKRGTWELNPLTTWGAGLFAFAIKGATDNAVYLMDTDETDGSWFVGDLSTNKGGMPDMSNIRLFGTAGLAPIPLPPVGFMLLGALGALAVAARRRRTA